jgi:hypothetical protein
LVEMSPFLLLPLQICPSQKIFYSFRVSMVSFMIKPRLSILRVILSKVWGPSLLWSYGSRIYNYLCNQCLSPLKFWVRNYKRKVE